MENKQKSLKLNFVMNVALTMSSIIFPIITFPYVSRILTPSGVGRVTFATSLISYFSIFAQLGIPTYGIRACAQVRDDKIKLSKTVQELLIINLIMSFFAYILLGIVLATVPRLFEDRILYIIISSTILLNVIGMEWLYKGLEKYSYITIRSVIFKFIALVAMFIFVHKKEDYIIYGAISIFAASASNILNIIHARRYINFSFLGNYNLRRHLKAVLVFFAMSCATTIYTNLDTVMLGFIKSDIDVGYYNAAVKIKVILVQVVSSLGGVLLPRCSYYVEKGMWIDFKRICFKAMNFVVLVAFPLSIYFIIYAKDAIMFLSGVGYLEAVSPMKIIMFTLLFIGMTNILGLQILVPLGKEKIVLYSEIAGAITDLLLNIVLIPKFSASGAAIGTLIAEFVVLSVQCIALKKQLLDIIIKIKYWKIILATVVSAIISMFVFYLKLGSFLNIVISAMIFLISYLFILMLLKEEMAKEIIKSLYEIFERVLKKNDRIK